MNRCPDPDFLASARTLDSKVFPLAGFDDWFNQAIARHRFAIEPIPFARLEKWSFDPTTGNLRHDSGKFFQVEGISVSTNFGGARHWTQPIINQPEIGFLGLIARRMNGVLHFLMQAKMEPGNLNTIQLSPTLQATKSNYTRVHQGRPPRYLEYFRDNPARRVLVDVLQSEQGGRFYRKRNRNIVIEVPEGQRIPESDDFIWLTLGQIQRLLRRSNVINMDARTVLSCMSFHRTADGASAATEPRTPAVHSEDGILAWLTEMKCQYELDVQRIPLNQVLEWRRDDHRVYHPSGNFFEVMAVRVEADNREVPAWTQPLVKPCREGLLALLVKEIGGVPHFLIQAKVEPGNFDIAEMAPTVQCLTGDYRRAPPDQRPPFLDYVLAAPVGRILYDAMQSEEGGRFYRDQNRNVLVRAGDDFPEELPPNYLWISHEQMKSLIRFNNIVNVQCRCLLSCFGADGPVS